ncbi:UMF1 family MFS transporter [Lipingzhangella halophila]|uniref:UMF1 family MFS transporter n=1 Tax=Lipingzhangella halophila TaxID=1783352 RepID=A0A7W7RH68_9ACTN|nr:MFS transporter [Lipingzhangella halophila]MBB4931553.1 UMF1 family MFS transporter [Lipingzhangella halophila]
MSQAPTDPTAGNAPSADPHQRRREQRGWYVYDWANSVFMTSVVTVAIGPYLSELACAQAGAPDTDACTGGAYYVHPLGLELHANSFYPAVTTVAILLQILLLPLMGAMVDQSRHKKAWLFWTAAVGSAATSAIYLAGDSYLAVGALFLIANVAYGASLVVYHAFLPEVATADERDRVSTTGWAVGYLGGALLLVVHLALIVAHDSVGVTEGTAVRIAIVSTGFWWVGFTVLALRPLRNRIGALAAARPGRPNPATSLRQLGHTLGEMRSNPHVILFLLAFILFNDGIQAAIRYASPFALQDLGLGYPVLMGTILAIQFVAFGGALAFGRIARQFGAKRTVLGTLVVWSALVTLGFLLPAGAPVLFVALGLGIGVVLGGTQALARSMFSQMIPHGREAEYFGIYQISERGSTFLGSLAVTIAVNLTGGYRVAIFSLIAFFILGGILLWKANLRSAIQGAGNELPTRI